MSGQTPTSWAGPVMLLLRRPAAGVGIPRAAVDRAVTVPQLPAGDAEDVTREVVVRHAAAVPDQGREGAAEAEDGEDVAEERGELGHDQTLPCPAHRLHRFR